MNNGIQWEHPKHAVSQMLGSYSLPIYCIRFQVLPLLPKIVFMYDQHSSNQCNLHNFNGSVKNLYPLKVALCWPWFSQWLLCIVACCCYILGLYTKLLACYIMSETPQDKTSIPSVHLVQLVELHNAYIWLTDFWLVYIYEKAGIAPWGPPSHQSYTYYHWARWLFYRQPADPPCNPHFRSFICNT